MKFRILLCLVLFSIIENAGIAQRETSETVTTRYISFPEFDVQDKSPSDFNAYMAIEKSKYSKKVFTKDVACAPANSTKLKDFKMVPNYFYSIDANRGDGYFIIKDQAENIYYSEELFDGTHTDNFIYGKEDCKFWMKELLEKDYEENKSKWEESEHEQFVINLKNRLEQTFKTKLLLTYIPEKVSVYSGKNRKQDYSELDRAQEQAIQAYRSLNEKGIDQAAIDQLKAPIETWKVIEGQIDWDNKKAKYNNRIGRALLYNLALAYFYQNDLENAMSYAEKADKAFGNYNDGSVRVRIGDLMQRIVIQKVGRAANKELLADYDLLHQRANAIDNNTVQINVLEDKKIPEMAFDHRDYKKSVAKANEAAKSDDMRAAGINPYQEKVKQTFKGQTLNIFIFDEELTTIPAEIFELQIDALLLGGQSIQSVPPGIGNMTGLKELDLSANEFKSIPLEIGNCTNLESLNLSRNKITSLPETIQNLKKLKKLNLKKTKISDADIAKIQSWLPDCKIKT